MTTAEAFAIAGGVTINSVHPSVDDAIAVSGYEVKRQSPTGAVLKNPNGPDGDNGGYYVTQITITTSEIHDGMWCQSGAEGTSAASAYFPEEEWMLHATPQPRSIAFYQSDIALLVQKGMAEDGFISAELTAEQFQIFEKYCSGSSISGGFEAATQWASAHCDELDAEAQGYADDDSDYPGSGTYHLPMGYCAFAAIEDFVFYETTSGTLLVVAKDGHSYVRIPEARRDGFHHSVLQNLLGGWTEDQIDRRINSHLYTDRVATPEKPTYDSSTDDSEYEDYDGADEEYDYA